MYPAVKFTQSFFQAFSIFLPHHPRRRLPFQAVIAPPQQIDVDVMQQRRKLQLLVMALYDSPLPFV